MKPHAPLIALIALASSSFGDIAPTRFVGSGISTAENTSIRMESADVEIQWGTPCKLSALFQMHNRASKPEPVTIGFPMPVQREPAKLSISIAGNKKVAEGPMGGASEETGLSSDWTWYFRKHVFAPGRTKVTVESDLRASLVYAAPYRESIFYCIETGGKWIDTIGTEVVVVRFPNEIYAEQLVDVQPAGYRINKNAIHWEFKELEPTSGDHDIKVTYIRPDVMAVITRLRQETEKDPENRANALELAKHLLALGYSKSNCGFPPGRLGLKEFEEVKNRITDEQSREMFVRRYRKSEDGFYEEINSEWTEERNHMIQILADVGYRDEESKISFIIEGEKILKELLRSDKKDSKAWNIYLANYWRFSFAAVGHWFGSTRFGKSQLESIEEAVISCPDDKCIQLWKECVENQHDEDRFAKLKAELESSDTLSLSFPEVKYDR